MKSVAGNPIGSGLILILILTKICQAQVLNDTGIQYQGSYPKGITTCSTNSSNEQDCHINKPLSYTKISAKGEPLPKQEASWSCILDNTTGLMWEVKNTDSKNLHFHRDTYTWYNSNRKQNGGNLGNWNRDGDSCFGYEPNKPRQFCHVEQFASRVNKAALCGFSDWRVPTRHELTSLIDFGQFQPSIQSRFFPYTEATFYWALEPHQNRAIEAWSVDFEFGTTTPLRKTDKRPVRLVRTSTKTGNIANQKAAVVTSYVEETTQENAQEPVQKTIREIVTKTISLPTSCNTKNVVPSKDYKLLKKIDDADLNGAVLDASSHLIWQRCLVGQYGSNCENGSPQSMTWLEALNSADKFADTGNARTSKMLNKKAKNNNRVVEQTRWRLPNIRELASLSELACSSPAINKSLFPTPQRATLWSSSPYRFYDHYAWYWESEDGIYIYGDRTEKRYVRLVRDAE